MRKLNVICCCCSAKPKTFLRAAISIILLFSFFSIVLTCIILFSIKTFKFWSIFNLMIIPMDIVILLGTLYLNFKNKSRGIKDYLIKVKVKYFVWVFLTIITIKIILFIGFAMFSTISLFIVRSYHGIYVNPDVISGK